MNTRNKIVALVISLLFCYSCKTNIESPVPLPGDADFSRYVSMGSCFASGYTDGALYNEGQQNSFPSMLAKVFSEAGGGVFKQPTVNSEIGIGLNGNSKMLLTYGNLCNGTTGYNTPYAAPTGDQSVWNNSIASEGPFNNLSVPGTKSYNFRDQYFGSGILVGGNPFYSRFAKIPGTSTLLSEAVDIDPTFFSLHIGREDIYNFAMNGGDDDPADSITSSSYFNSNVDIILTTLVSNGAKGVIANIPDVADFPFFTTIPFNGLVLTATQAQYLNSIFTSIDPQIIFHEGNNPYLTADISRPSGLRRLKEGELVLKSVSIDSMCVGFGSFNQSTMTAWPFEDKDVLDLAELSLIRSRIFDFNQKIKTTADQNNLAFVDLYDFFRRLSNGIVFNGVKFNSEFVNGKAISLDGLYPTPQGYALIANEFIHAINSKFGSTLHEVNANSYPGIHFP